MGYRKFPTATIAGSVNDNVILYADAARTERIDTILEDRSGHVGDDQMNLTTNSVGVYPTFYVDEKYSTVYGYFPSATVKLNLLTPTNEYYSKAEDDVVSAARYTKTESDAKYEVLPTATADATLVGGTVTVSNAAVKAGSRIELWCKTPGGTPGAVFVSAKTADTSFVITSTSGTDTSVVGWRAWW